MRQSSWSGVDSWESWLSTSVSPADDSVKSESAHEWATGVSLAGVLATGVKTGTDHRVGDVILTISISAVIVTDNWDFDLHEGTGQGSSLRCGSRWSRSRSPRGWRRCRRRCRPGRDRPRTGCGSNSNSQSAGRLSITAMSGGDDSVGGD